MRFYYDLHIHSCLSPCGDDEMTPYNIVGMAKLIGLDLIAITDHNSSRNAPAVLKAASEYGLIALPGMELTTSEDVHIVMLFPTLEAALGFNDYVDFHKLRVDNRPEIYGNQLVIGDDDAVIGHEQTLLISATDIGVYEAAQAAAERGGVAVAAHIDRDSNGLVAVLGDIEKDMGFKTVEFSKHADRQFMQKYIGRGYRSVSDSDAHRLEDISERVNFLELDECTPEAVIKWLRGD